MARKLQTFPAKSTHPWDEYLDGSVWELTEGEDFTSKLATFRMNAKAQAERRGGKVRTSVQRGQDGDPDKLVIQFYKETGKPS